MLLQSLLDHGLRLVQLRNKGIPIAEIEKKIEHILPLFESYNAELIINDHLNLAQHFGLGVHLGISDGDPILARELLGTEATIGITVHDDLQRINQYKEIVTYVGSGPVFPTSTKHDTKPVIGVQRLKEVVATAPLPVVAIGGIHLDNIKYLLSARPRYIAVCSAICSAENPQNVFISLQKTISAL